LGGKGRGGEKHAAEETSKKLEGEEKGLLRVRREEKIDK